MRAVWEDYLHWQQTDKAMLRKVNPLIQAIRREPFGGIGQPEPLRHDLRGYWSRRITDEHRLVYFVAGDTVDVLQCRYHYDS
ncbi:MAG: Txe/YoeB family addiction module toxin [Chromatiales bacterium]|nr:Txe/YoeB family addiction module toxin [Chromatiales bacterium]